MPNNLAAIERAFSAVGITLLDETESEGRGVRHRLPGERAYELEERLRIVRALNRGIEESAKERNRRRGDPTDDDGEGN